MVTTGMSSKSPLFVCIVIAIMASMCTGPKQSMKQFDEIVQAYLAGNLVEEKGLIHLSSDLSSATQDGCVYITHAPWGTALLFITWRGKGSNLRGYVYSKELANVAPADGKAFTTEMIGPVIWAKLPELMELQLEHSDSADWYRASRSLD